jgi:hypothetical protein
MTRVRVVDVATSKPSKQRALCLQVLKPFSCPISLRTQRNGLAIVRNSPSKSRLLAYEVQSTLGHGNIATTSGYRHARPNTSSGLHLDPEPGGQC